jgi:hypothetical protein
MVLSQINRNSQQWQTINASIREFFDFAEKYEHENWSPGEIQQLCKRQFGGMINDLDESNISTVREWFANNYWRKTAILCLDMHKKLMSNDDQSYKTWYNKMEIEHQHDTEPGWGD